MAAILSAWADHAARADARLSGTARIEGKRERRKALSDLVRHASVRIAGHGEDVGELGPHAVTRRESRGHKAERIRIRHRAGMRLGSGCGRDRKARRRDEQANEKNGKRA